MNNIFIGNIIEVVIFVGSIIANVQINRRKYLYWWVFLNILGSAAFIALCAYEGALVKGYNAIRIAILLILYKDDKIVPSALVSVILGIPYIIIMFINYKTGGFLGLLIGLSQFVSNQDFIFKREIHRYETKIISDFGFVVYDLANYDYVGFARHVVEAVTFAIDIYRVKKNGEKVYYKK